MEKKQITIVTHSGKYHADDVWSCAFLRFNYDDELPPKIIRSRDENDIKNADIVVDVGGVYDPAHLRFDHHQKTFTEKFSDDPRIVTIMSSSGQVLKHLGGVIIPKMLMKFPEKTFPDGITLDINEVMFQLYLAMVHEIDAQDNGKNAVDAVEHRVYPVCGIGKMISRMYYVNRTFDEAMDRMSELIKDAFADVISLMLTKKSDMLALEKSSFIKKDGKCIIVMRGDCSDIVSAIEPYELKHKVTLMFSVYKRSDGFYGVSGIRKDPDFFGLRKNLLPEPELKKKFNDIGLDASKIKFVHKGLFIAVTEDKASAIMVALLSI